MLGDNSTLERLVISNTDMTEVGFTAVLAALRKGNSTITELSIGSQLLRSREVFFATRREILTQRDADAFVESPLQSRLCSVYHAYHRCFCLFRDKGSGADAFSSDSGEKMFSVCDARRMCCLHLSFSLTGSHIGQSMMLPNHPW